MECLNYCEHGGICILKNGHKGNHKSGYCKWDNEHTFTKEEADEILIAKEPVIGKLIAEAETKLREFFKNGNQDK